MFTASFTSAQGTDHVDAPVRIVQANHNTNSTNSLSVDFSQSNDATPETHAYEHSELSYQAVFWASQAAYDDGLAPFKVLDTTRNENHRISQAVLESPEYAGLSLEASAEKHCLENVLQITV